MQITTVHGTNPNLDFTINKISTKTKIISIQKWHAMPKLMRNLECLRIKFLNKITPTQSWSYSAKT